MIETGSNTSRPWRSVLYIPGSKPRALEKARDLDCDAIIFDLEDAVSLAEKDAARQTLAAALGMGGYGARATILRINGLDTPWWRDDLAALAETGAEAVLLPKVGSADDVATLAREMGRYDGYGNAAIWAMIETPQGVLNAAQIASAPRLAGFVIGTNDLAKELGCEPGQERAPLMLALQQAVLAARAAGIPVIDGVYNAFKDEAGLERECRQGRALGMDGKSLIHPAQLAVTNKVFAPDAAEVEMARRQIAAFAEAEAQGQGVAVLDGKIVENLHVARARKILARADAIRDRSPA